MMALFLRRWNRQYRIEGREGLGGWDDDTRLDYAVVDDFKIGRMMCREHGPLKGHWDWFLHVMGDRSELKLHGTAPSLEAAKADLKAEYDKGSAKNLGRPIR